MRAEPFKEFLIQTNQGEKSIKTRISKRNHIKKKFYILLSIIFILLAYVGCKPSKNSIKLINSKTYGKITPIDIYEITNGYMTTTGEITNRKNHPLPIDYEYCAYQYLDKKTTSILDNTALVRITDSTLKITWGYSDFFGNTSITYYSEFFGEKQPVMFVANVTFKKTYYIKLQEKSDTYKITYYDIKNEKGLHSIKSINNYKKTIEILKTDVTKIEYF